MSGWTTTEPEAFLPVSPPGTKCAEFAGRATGTGYRRECERTATREAWFLGVWRPLCRYHVGQYSDLPQRSIGPAR